MTVNDKKLNTVGKAISVIEAIRTARKPLSIKEISEAVGLNKSSLHHHVKSLAEYGYLQQEPETRKYDIGLNLVRVGQSYLQRLDVRERGHSYLEQLSKQLNETVHMLVLDHDEAVYVDKVDVHHQPGALQCTSFIGLRTDVYSTASGKVLLSNLERGSLDAILKNLQMQPRTPHTLTDVAAFEKELMATKERGYGLDLQEHSLGLQCIAIPVLNSHSQCVAAVSVSTPVATISRDVLETDVLSKLLETGRQISAAMGYIGS
ncbi:IclR family transcriptional regulator [Granulosicoccaceae sp. 1_MG-2023]|nr:IclR family transcriptional regulator [Granulosicoccaceae sp. 1_MG-2023]